MAGYSIYVGKRARADYNALDAPLKPEVLRKIKALRQDPFPSGSKPLSGPLRGYTRLAIGRSIRVVYKVDGSLITVLVVGQHENFYDEAIRRLTSLGAKVALPTSWRPMVEESYWRQHDVTISSEGGGSGRRSYEVHVHGVPFSTRPSLTEAKASVEEVHGELEWHRVKVDPYEVTHYWFGETPEFAPSYIWTARLDKQA